MQTLTLRIITRRINKKTRISHYEQTFGHQFVLLRNNVSIFRILTNIGYMYCLSR